MNLKRALMLVEVWENVERVKLKEALYLRNRDRRPVGGRT